MLLTDDSQERLDRMVSLVLHYVKRVTPKVLNDYMLLVPCVSLGATVVCLTNNIYKNDIFFCMVLFLFNFLNFPLRETKL